MNRREFMEELEWLLMDLPKNEREDAIAYYNSYLDEAGPERESEILAEFGSPKEIASMIKDDLAYEEQSWAQYTETGYQDAREVEQVPVPTYTVQEYKEPRDRKLPNIFWIILLVFSAPIWLSVLGGIGGGIIGLLGGIVGAVFGILGAIIGLGAATASMAVAGIVSGIGAIISGFVHIGQPAEAVFRIGVGSLMIAGGLLCSILTIWIFSKGVPAAWHLVGKIWEWFGRICRKIFRRIRREV